MDLGPGRGPGVRLPVGRRLAQAARTLLGEALASDDAEAGGLHADDVLADPEMATALLGDPAAWPAARMAVVQRYGRVGALLVMGYEGRFRSRHGSTGDGNPRELELLVDGFAVMDVHEVHEVLSLLDGLDEGDRRSGRQASASGAGTQAAGWLEAEQSDSVAARRWLEATYAIAARDGTEADHRAYMRALDRVMRLAARRLAS